MAGDPLKNLRALRAGLKDQVANAVFAEAEVQIATPAKKLCPVDVDNHFMPKLGKNRVPPHAGNLRNSIHVEGPFREGKKVSAIVCTGKQAPYDVYVHENLKAHHPVGQAKFIETPLNESKPNFSAGVAKRIDLRKAINDNGGNA